MLRVQLRTVHCRLCIPPAAVTVLRIDVSAMPQHLVQLHKHVAWCQASNTVQSPIKAAVASAFETCSKTATRAHRQWCEHRKCNDACRKLFCFSEHIQHSAACKSSSMQGRGSTARAKHNLVASRLCLMPTATTRPKHTRQT